MLLGIKLMKDGLGVSGLCYPLGWWNTPIYFDGEISTGVTFGTVTEGENSHLMWATASRSVSEASQEKAAGTHLPPFLLSSSFGTAKIICWYLTPFSSSSQHSLNLSDSPGVSKLLASDWGSWGIWLLGVGIYQVFFFPGVQPTLFGSPASIIYNNLVMPSITISFVPFLWKTLTNMSSLVQRWVFLFFSLQNVFN